MLCLHIQVSETVEAGVPVEVEEDMSEAPVPVAQDNGKCTIADLEYKRQRKTNKLNKTNDCFFHLVNIQQITEFSSETYDAVTSMVAMAPGTVTVVQQVKHTSVLKKLCKYFEHFKPHSLTIFIHSCLLHSLSIYSKMLKWLLCLNPVCVLSAESMYL